MSNSTVNCNNICHAGRNWQTFIALMVTTVAILHTAANTRLTTMTNTAPWKKKFSLQPTTILASEKVRIVVIEIQWTRSQKCHNFVVKITYKQPQLHTIFFIKLFKAMRLSGWRFNTKVHLNHTISFPFTFSYIITLCCFRQGLGSRKRNEK